MGKYLITGRQGSGKTTVIRALQALGYKAYNTDEMHGLTRLEDRKTGEHVEWPKGAVNWNIYAWNWQEKPLLELLKSNATVFIGAVTANQSDYYKLFDIVFALNVTHKTLQKHLNNHEHNYHKDEITRILDSHAERQPRYARDGAIEIDNNGPVSETIDHILRYISEH